MSQTAAPVAGTVSVPLSSGRIQVDRWPTEGPLFAVSLVTSVLLWIVAAVSIVGLLYGAILGVFFFVMHVVFVAHVRGSGVRLGPDQFPELHTRVESIASRMAMERVPATYLMQAGGSLNAFATRFLGANIVVLFSDLLDACGDNEAARDMIIAHELGHVHEGHLRWHWFLLPSKLVPFLGSALSRAREYTCDRYGLAGAGDRDGALLGLTILAAGGTHGPRVNREALMRQRPDIDTGWMTIGEWLSSHPPLVKRMAELDPALRRQAIGSSAGKLRALAILALLILPLTGGSILAMTLLPRWMGSLEQLTAASPLTGADAEAAAAETQRSFARMAAFLDGELAEGRPLPESGGELYDRFAAAHPGEPVPLDAFDGDVLGYDVDDHGYTLWSSGPDGIPRTEDDIVVRR